MFRTNSVYLFIADVPSNQVTDESVSKNHNAATSENKGTSLEETQLERKFLIPD